MCSLSGITRIAPNVPIDPITTKALDKAPDGVREMVNPAGPVLRRAVGEESATQLINFGAPDPNSKKQAKTLLGQ